MSGKVRDTTWKPIAGMEVRDTTWKPVLEAWVRDGGAWKSFYVQPFVGFLRPNADVDVTGWTLLPINEKLDEVTPDDATTETISQDFDDSGSEQVHDFEVHLSNPGDTPNGTEVMTIRVRHRLEIELGATVVNNVIIRLKQGGTTIRQYNTSSNEGSYVTTTFTLSQAQKDAITDYDDLRIFYSLGVQMDQEGDWATGRVTWAEMQFEAV